MAYGLEGTEVRGGWMRLEERRCERRAESNVKRGIVILWLKIGGRFLGVYEGEK